MTDFVIVLCTAPPHGAEKMARALVQERLAACVNVSSVRSYFSWEGKLSDEPEELMIIKTESRMVGKIKARIKELHSYQVPEIIVMPIIDGEKCYLDWVSQSLG
ncbi:MAG TPA: divalent-cation tolerance protein CutA [Methanotrichaceae archaeon]|nr:divalent-cation tolerance protein CutA [Methanotrichaceae archaeon]